jgi:glutathione S-transferase kappa 1
MPPVPPRATIEFFYDVVSPYSFLAFVQLRNIASAWNVKVEWKPFFLGGVMRAAGNQPPAVVPAKGAHLVTDVRRSLAYLGLEEPKKFPPSAFPVSTILAQRALTVLSAEGREVDQLKVAEALWRSYFMFDQDISQPAVVQEILESVLGAEETKDVLTKAGGAETKDRLKAVTEDAVARGAFGAPTMFVNTKSMYFGADRFHLIAHELGYTWPPPGMVATTKANPVAAKL